MDAKEIEAALKLADEIDMCVPTQRKSASNTIRKLVRALEQAQATIQNKNIALEAYRIELEQLKDAAGLKWGDSLMTFVREAASARRALGQEK